MPRYQFSLRALLAVAGVFVALAAIVTLSGTQWGKGLLVCGLFAGGIALIVVAGKIYERSPGATWPVAVGFLGVIVIMAALLAWVLYVAGGYANV